MPPPVLGKDQGRTFFGHRVRLHGGFPVGGSGHNGKLIQQHIVQRADDGTAFLGVFILDGFRVRHRLLGRHTKARRQTHDQPGTDQRQDVLGVAGAQHGFRNQCLEKQRGRRVLECQGVRQATGQRPVIAVPRQQMNVCLGVFQPVLEGTRLYHFLDRAALVAAIAQDSTLVVREFAPDGAATTGAFPYLKFAGPEHDYAGIARPVSRCNCALRCTVTSAVSRAVIFT